MLTVLNFVRSESDSNMASEQYDHVGSLKFDFNDLPKWRHDGRPTSELLSDIVRLYGEYQGLPKTAKEFVENSFAKLMATKFVFNVNVGESIGTQTADGTQAVLEDYLLNNQQAGDRKKQETINVYKALLKLFSLHKGEMENTGKLTVQQICDVHKELMSELHKDAGKMRTGAAFVHWNDDYYFYPEPRIAEQLFFASIDHHCIHLSTYAEKFANNAPSVASFGYLYKCAARLMFDFVDAHPFGDGNGRMCRLLANYVLCMITPFPVAPYCGEKGREDYLNAIVECRDDRSKGPGTLAAMLIEGAWRGWTSLFGNLERNNLLSPKRSIGPVVIRKSDESRMQWITKALDRFKIAYQPNMLECVAQAIDEASVSEDAATSKVINLSDDVDLHLQIYE